MNLKDMKDHQVSLAAKDFICTYGGSHVSLLKGLDACPENNNSSTFLYDCLCFVIQQRSHKEVAKRLLGRYRRVRNAEEDALLDQAFGEDVLS